MKDYRPNGCKMYVANKDIEFSLFDDIGSLIIAKKGDVWILKQITFGGKVWLTKKAESESILQISQEQLENDFVEVNFNDINMDTVYKFFDTEQEDNMCSKTVLLNGYEITSETFSWSFDDFCEHMGYPLDKYIDGYITNNECELLYMQGEHKCDGTIAVLCSGCKSDIFDYVDNSINYRPICGRKIKKETGNERDELKTVWEKQTFSTYHKPNEEANNAFETVDILVRAKINRLCKEHRYKDAECLEEALSIINSVDYTT